MHSIFLEFLCGHVFRLSLRHKLCGSPRIHPCESNIGDCTFLSSTTSAMQSAPRPCTECIKKHCWQFSVTLSFRTDGWSCMHFMHLIIDCSVSFKSRIVGGGDTSADTMIVVIDHCLHKLHRVQSKVVCTSIVTALAPSKLNGADHG